MNVLVFNLGVVSLVEAERLSLRRLNYWTEQAEPYLEALARMQQQEQQQIGT